MFGRFKNFSNPMELSVGRVFFRDTAVQVHRVGDVHMVLDHRAADAGSIRGCVSSPMYRELLDKVKLPTTLTVLDVGANVGGFPLLLHSLGHDIADLTSVELNPRTYVRLHFNILSNWPQATVLNRAVTAEAGEITVNLGHGDTGDSLSGSPKGAGEATRISTVRLDDLMDGQKIDILKMDIEGAEVDVLLNPGHENTLARTNVLVIEIHPLDRAQEIHDVITGAGLSHVWGPDELIGQHIFARQDAM